MKLSDEPGDGEIEVIERLCRRLPPPPPGEVWLGDDAALIGDGWVVTTDALVSGVDWDVLISTPADVGWKAVMVNASDLAAMGSATSRLLVTVVGPSALDIDALYDGIEEATATLGAGVVGGDISGVPADAGCAVVSVTAAGRAPAAGVVTRAGARPGDAIWLSGAVGAAAAGLRMLRAGGDLVDACARAHVRPQARVDAGQHAASVGATAMIDVSDGLSGDAWHIARASSVVLAFDDVPVAEGATLDEALAGGDDYELLCAAPPDVDLPGWIRVGSCVAGVAGVTLRNERVDPRGYRHWRAS